MSTFVGYLLPNLSFQKSSDAILPIDKMIHTFPQSIHLKVDIITLMGFELTHFEATDEYFSDQATRTSPTLQ